MGVYVTINSDDLGMMRFDIVDEYVAVYVVFGYDLEIMEDLSFGVIDVSFVLVDECAVLCIWFFGEFDALWVG